MAAAPMISVVTPCHNHARFLREAIDSVGMPSRSVEVVVVNDGSTDDSGVVAEEYARTPSNGIRVRVFHQANAGAAAARNRGFDESHGQYVVFLDSDDRLAPNALDTGARALDEHPESVFVYGRCQIMASDGTLLPTPQEPRIEHHAYHELLRRNFIWTPANVMFRLDALKRCGAFNATVTGLADYELYLRLARTHPIHDHGQLVTHYRRRDASVSPAAAEMLRETLMVLRSQLPYVDGDPEAMAAYRDGWRNWQDFYGSQLVNEIGDHLQGGEWAPALQKALVLAVLHPRGVVHHTSRKLRRVGAPGVLKGAGGV
jgi:glycosyltransferase involved in cell wall biosynthesis